MMRMYSIVYIYLGRVRKADLRYRIDLRGSFNSIKAFRHTYIRADRYELSDIEYTILNSYFNKTGIDIKLLS